MDQLNQNKSPRPQPILSAESLSKHAKKAQREGFHAARKARRSELVEDYVELIAELIGQEGVARPVDIARRLGVKQPTVSKNLARLKREGYILHERYRSIFLTDLGQDLAAICRARHRTIVSFLIALGLDKATAEQDAEGIEHHVSDQTLLAFKQFIDSNLMPMFEDPAKLPTVD